MRSSVLRISVFSLLILASAFGLSAGFRQFRFEPAVHADETYGSSAPSALHVDLRDLADFGSSLLPQASQILSALRARPARFFPAGIDLSDGGTAAGKVYGVELSELPTVAEGGGTVINLQAFIRSARAGDFFRKLRLTITDVGEVTVAETVEDVPLKKVHFSLSVGLIQRKAILEDTIQGIRKIYPLGVGGFDEGITAESRGETHLMTPLYSGASLNAGTAIPAVWHPAYYLGLPYLPVTRKDGVVVGIAMHIIQHPQMVRGFDSHGCMRLRKKDLNELFTILTQGNARIPLDISLVLSDAEDHPYPLRDDGYERVVNCAAPGQPPRSCNDEHGLTRMADLLTPPPLASLAELRGSQALPTNGLLPQERLEISPIDVQDGPAER